MAGKIIGVISIKGGVGKTTTVANLAATLTHDFGKKVLAVDANFTAPNLGLHLGVTNQQPNLHSVLANKALIHEAIYEHEFGFHILPTSLINYEVNPFLLRDKISSLRKSYDYVLVDSSPNLNSEMLSTILSSDELIVVTTPDYPTLSCTLKAIKVAKQKKTPIAGIIINKVQNKSYELNVEDIEKATGTPVIGVIRDNNKVVEALSQVTPVSLFSPISDPSIGYKTTAAIISESFYKRPNTVLRSINTLKESFDNIKNHNFSASLSYYR